MKKTILYFILVFFSYSIEINGQCYVNAGQDDTICGHMYQFQGVSSYGTHTEWILPLGSVMPDPHDPNGFVYINITPWDTFAPVTYQYILMVEDTTLSCISFDTVNITFKSRRYIDAGNPQAVCGSTTQLQAFPSGPIPQNGYWTSNVPGVTITYSGSDSIPWNPVVDVSGISNFYTNNQLNVLFTLHVQNEYGCSTCDSTKIDFYNTSFIQGNITEANGSNYVKVRLYKASTPGQPFIAESDVGFAGFYSMQIDDSTDYWLRAEQLHPEVFELVSTYYQNSLMWENATVINVSACSNIFMLPMIDLQSTAIFDGTISGQILYDITNTPVPNVSVMLLDSLNNLVKMSLTDTIGNYQIIYIPDGTYTIHCDIPGLPQVTTYTINISSTTPIYSNINFIVDSSTISKNYGFGIYVDTTASHINSIQGFNKELITIYPNPSNNRININLPKNDIYTIKIYNINGKEITKILNQRIKSEIQIDSFVNGLYFVKIIGNNFEYNVKFIKE